MKKLFTARVIKMTLIISMIYIMVMVLVSCLDQTSLENPFGTCPPSQAANVDGLKIHYYPYQNSRYSLETDTVSYQDFAVVLELIPELLSNNDVGKFPGQAFALSCLASYEFRNISNIALILTSSFAGLPPGTDISYLLELGDKTLLSEFRDFQNTPNFFLLKLTKEPSTFEQLKTKTIIFLRNGTQITVDSSSLSIQTS